MKKQKTPSLKEIEAQFKNWSNDPERMKATKARNAAMRSSKEAKDGKINMRVPTGDLEALKSVAEQKGVPYQTLLGMIIHQYVQGTLVDIEEIKKILKAG